ncbi:MAG: hypothetical protein IRZ28_11195 [Steroidobacteraceae bacterium]|nr:hypothetical protein [Steroidobacteraceae bacterium]
MGKHVLKDVTLTVNGVDISTFANEVTIEDTADEVDVTGFTTAGYREFAQGLKDATITATIFQDYSGTASPHAVLRPLYESGGTFTVKVNPNQGGTSVASMVARLYSYSGIGGAVGDANQFEVVFRHAGTAGVTWGTA